MFEKALGCPSGQENAPCDKVNALMINQLQLYLRRVEEKDAELKRVVEEQLDENAGLKARV